MDSSNTPIHVQFKIDGVSPWMDANDSFSPGSAEVDGVTAVDASKTTNHLQKKLAFPDYYTGAAYVRIGLPAGSTAQITNVSVSY